MRVPWRRKPISRPEIEVEMPLVSAKGRVWLNGVDISRWCTGIEMTAHVGEISSVTLHVLPEHVRLRLPRPVRYVTTGEDGVTREVTL